MSLKVCQVFKVQENLSEKKNLKGQSQIDSETYALLHTIIYDLIFFFSLLAYSAVHQL